MRLSLFFLFLCIVPIFIEAQVQTTRFNDNVTIEGDLNVTRNIIAHDIRVCLQDGTNCPSNLTTINGTDTIWNITGSKYLANFSGILDVNETILNATISALAGSVSGSFWEISIMLAIILSIFSIQYNFSLLEKEKGESNEME